MAAFRFSEKVRNEIRDELNLYIDYYYNLTGIHYDPANGWSQVLKLALNKDNYTSAAIVYGRIIMLEDLLG